MLNGYSPTRSVTVNKQDYALRLDDTGTYTYIGKADAGSLDASAVWQIRRMENATCNIVYADGNVSFDNVWNNRTGLSYS